MSEANSIFQVKWRIVSLLKEDMSSIKYCVVESGFEPRSSQTKDYKIGICCFSAKHAALRRKSKDWLTQNQNNVSEWGYMSIRRLLFQWASTLKIQLSVLVLYKADHIIMINCWVGIKQQLLTHSLYEILYLLLISSLTVDIYR
jgi:hypothetical protein